jgi:hypothetical protein
MTLRAILCVMVVGVYVGLLWVWAAIPFVSPDACLLMAVVGGLVVPIVAVLRWDLRGVLLGSPLVLCSLLVLRRVGTALDPTFRGDDVASHIKVLLLGSAVAIVFCFMIYGMKRLAIRLALLTRRPTR